MEVSDQGGFRAYTKSYHKRGKENFLKGKAMIERVLSKQNMTRAYKQVRSNKGSSGVDGLKVEGLQSHLQLHWHELAKSILDRKYTAQPILGVEIRKENGKTRLLGIPTVTDRVLQQAVSQIWTPIFEPDFQDHSYGFRPRRNAHQAIKQAKLNINEGYQYIIDTDLRSFFDEVAHDKLLNLIYQKVKCPITLCMIRRWLRAPMQINGKLVRRRKGIPQGSPISPLLSNIILNELDKELEKRGHRYVRYADDFSIYVKSKKASQRVSKSIHLFLENRLHLPINREKSGIRRPHQFKILGYGFVPTYKKGEKAKYQLVVAAKAWKRLKQKIKFITRKPSPMSFEERINRLKLVQRGWINYFRHANIFAKLKKMDEWVRNRIRYCIWHDWKKPERKRKNLSRLGKSQGQAYAWSRTRMGGWAVACSPILRTTITLNRLQQRGYISLLTIFGKLTHA